MASSSSSSPSTHHYSYDVFPSFSSKDVGRTFLSHFLEGLKSKGIKTFQNNGIMRSEYITTELARAIEESRISVVILSKNYPSSSWCLNELQRIMKCKVSLGQIVMAIFYDVDPSDVREQTGDFGKVFEETCYGKTDEQKKKWRKALSHVAVIAGEHSISWASEAEMISKIVMDVSNELPSTDFDQLVGIEAHVAKLKAMVCLESDEVKVVGIWGPAGIGKATIARALYNQVSRNFQLKFYREPSWKRASNTMEFQEELLSGVLDHRDMKIPNKQEAIFRLMHQRVLVVIDCVSFVELQALQKLVQQWYLRFGSKVIVTNADLYTFTDNGIEQIYKVTYPSREEALQIFSYAAFGQSDLPQEILGSALRGKNKEEWTMAPAKVNTCLVDTDIQKATRFAHDGLSKKHKRLFYLLTRETTSSSKNLNNAIYTLSGSDWDVEKGLQTLADMALISISEGGEIMMHGLVQSMSTRLRWNR
uniref:TIR domain-containing protein n=1 Tax=Brassica campestris TaxID=3711 RepID=M4E4E6_BRACM